MCVEKFLMYGIDVNQARAENMKVSFCGRVSDG